MHAFKYLDYISEWNKKWFALKELTFYQMDLDNFYALFHRFKRETGKREEERDWKYWEGWETWAILSKVVRVGFIGKVICQQRLGQMNMVPWRKASQAE